LGSTLGTRLLVNWPSSSPSHRRAPASSASEPFPDRACSPSDLLAFACSSSNPITNDSNSKALPRPFRLHDTRHTAATLLLAAGVDLYAVARILRHTDPKVTFETYARLVPGYLHEQIDRLQLGRFAAQVLAKHADPLR
jgi:hypothetical protein